MKKRYRYSDASEEFRKTFENELLDKPGYYNQRVSTKGSLVKCAYSFLILAGIF